MAGKSAPFSLRLSEQTDRLVTAEAKRTKRSKGSLVESLAEEALKARLIPGIAFRGDDYERRAWLIGTSLDVWQVVEAYEDFETDADRMVAATDVTERELRIALSYYERFPEEVDSFIALNRRSVSDLRAEHPHADVIASSSTDRHGAAAARCPRIRSADRNGPTRARPRCARGR
jgi:hypothetical protein